MNTHAFKPGRRERTAVTLLTFTAIALTSVATSSTSRSDGISEQEIYQHASYLASDELEGRLAGHRGAELAASYIVEQLKAYGFNPLGETWELPFYVRGGATTGFARIIFGSTPLSAPNLVQTPSYSPAGVVRAPLATDTSADLAGKIVAVDAEEGIDERERAAELIQRGAAGIIFLREESQLKPAAPAPSVKLSSERPAEEQLSDLSEELRRLVLESVRLDVPVIDISGNLRDYVLSSAADGLEVTIEVRRLGRDGSTNVAGILPGADPELRHEFVIVCGHYDHIGISGGEVHYGADDNASGTAAMLEVAEALATRLHRPRRSIVVIAWGAEELHMIGSKAFCRNPPIDLEKIAAVINLDMVGRNDPNAVEILAASDDLRRTAVDAATRHGFTDTDGGDPISLTATDTSSFVKRKIPSLTFHTGLHPDYNTPRDTVDRLDIDKITRIARAAFELALEVANADDRPTFTVVDPDLEVD